MLITLDLNDDNNLIPEGVYEAQVIDARVKQSATSGNSYLSIRLAFEDPTYPDLYDTIMIPSEELNASAKQVAKRRLRNFLNACGINKKGVVEVNLDELVGKFVKVFVGIEHRATTDGEVNDRNRVVRYVSEQP